MVFAGISSGIARTDNTVSSPAGGLSNYDLVSEPPYQGTTSTESLCATPNVALNMPTDCAMVIVLTDLLNKGYDNNGQSEVDSGYKCIACKAGYKPSFDDKKFVNQCTLISNCEETMFNGCKKCASGYSFLYSLNHKATFYNECIDSSTIPHCYSGLTSNNKFYCRECKAGYYLNNDGHCDLLALDNCSTVTKFIGFNTISFYPLQTEKFEFLMNFKPAGCSQCESGYLATDLSVFQNTNYCI